MVGVTRSYLSSSIQLAFWFLKMTAIKTPSGVMVVCPMAGSPIEIAIWDETGTKSEIVTKKRALQLVSDLMEAILRTEET